MNPFLNFKDLSDSQLYDKVSELMNQIQIIKRSGYNLEVITQLEMSLASVRQEIENRSTRGVYESLKTESPVVWDMCSSVEDKRGRIRDARTEDQNSKGRRWRPTERGRRNRGTQ